MKRIGIAFTGVPFSIEELVNYVKLAEKKGFESVWFAEDYYLRDSITPLACFALSTKKIKIAAGVINPYTRHPALIAMTIATLDELSHGRAILGMGAGVPSVIKQIMPQMRPLATVKDCIEVIRKLLKEENVSYDGKMVKVNKVTLGVCPYFEPYGRFRVYRNNIPIYVAGMSPKMLQLTGEVGDGALISVGFSPEHTKKAIENIKIGAEKAKRKFEDLDIAAYILFSPSKDGTISEATKGFISLCVTQFFDMETLRLSGFKEDEVEKIKESYTKGGYKEAVKYITDDMVNALGVAGTPEKCHEGLERYEKVGVKIPIILPLGVDDVKFAINTASEYASS